jgi:hypothetical protein
LVHGIASAVPSNVTTTKEGGPNGFSPLSVVTTCLQIGALLGILIGVLRGLIGLARDWLGLEKEVEERRKRRVRRDR